MRNDDDAPVQHCSDGGEGLRAIYERADAIVAEAEAEAGGLDLTSPDRWEEALGSLEKFVLRLAQECFHDGAYGPGTAAIDPRRHLDRMRELYRFTEGEHRLPEALPERIGRIVELAKASGLEEIVLRNPNRWLEASAPGILEVLEKGKDDPSRLEMEITVPDPDGVDKWVGAALPRMVVNGTRMVVHGPHGLQALVERALAT